MMVRKTLTMLAFCGFALGMTACGQSASSWVTGASLQTSQQNNDDYVTLSAQLNTGGMSLIPVTLPILNPHNLTQQIGQIAIKSGLGSGASELDIGLDLTQILSLPDNGAAGLLPNGTAIPVAGLNAQNWISLPVANGKTRAYINIDLQNKKIALGAAVNIDQLQLGIPADLLLPFSASKISGVAGVYTGVAAGQSGFAIFVDASALLSSKSVLAFSAAKSANAVQVQQKLYQLDMQGASLKAK